MSLADDIAADLTAHHFNTDEFAESVTYNGTTIAAVVEYGEDPATPKSYAGAGARSQVERADLWVKVADVARPAYRDTVVIGGRTWYVRGVLSGDGFVWRIHIETNERVSAF